MRQHITLAILCFFIFTTANAQPKPSQKFSIDIDVSSIKPVPEMLILVYFNTKDGKSQSYQDSAGVRNGKVTFTGEVTEPSFATLQTKYFGEAAKFILSANRLAVKIGTDITKMSITGSPYQKDFEIIMAKKKTFEDKMASTSDKYSEAIKNKDSIAAKRYTDEFMELNRRSATEVYKNYAESHAKTSALSVFALQQYAGSGLKGVDSIYNSLSSDYKKLPTAEAIKQQINEKVRVSIGKSAPVFSQPDTSGKMVALNSFRGKYVLLDFWASWCHPCREESPYLIVAYEKFRTKNFEILSISLDSEKAKSAWLKAIKDDKVEKWTHVSDLKGFENIAGKLYGIQSIPQNFLIDPSGKIIAVNLRGAALEAALEKIIK